MSDDEDSRCSACHGTMEQLGTLGRRAHFRCRDCGAMSSSTDERAPMLAEQIVAREVNVRAYAHGFAAGATNAALGGAKGKRHTVEPATHAHWRKGYEDGRLFAETMIEKYRLNLNTNQGVTDGKATKNDA